MKVLICDHADCMMPDHALEIETLRAGLGEYSTAFLRVVLLRWGGRLLLLGGLLYWALIVCKAPVTAILGGLTAGAATALITFAVASRNARR